MHDMISIDRSKLRDTLRERYLEGYRDGFTQGQKDLALELAPRLILKPKLNKGTDDIPDRPDSNPDHNARTCPTSC